MAEQVSREVLCALAAQGCTADLEAHLTQQQCLVVGDFMESGQPECLMKVYTSHWTVMFVKPIEQGTHPVIP